MSEPPQEYYDAKNFLEQFRDEVFRRMTTQYVADNLQAENQGVNKILEKLSSISLDCDVVWNINRPLPLLKLADKRPMELGRYGFSAQYSGSLSTYHTPECDNIDLPPVDVWVYTPPSLDEISKNASQQMINSACGIRCPPNTFQEEPDISDAQYDYYSLHMEESNAYNAGVGDPITIGGKYAEIITGHLWRGYRELTRSDTGDVVGFIGGLITDATVEWSDDTIEAKQLVYEIRGFPIDKVPDDVFGYLSSRNWKLPTQNGAYLVLEHTIHTSSWIKIGEYLSYGY